MTEDEFYDKEHGTTRALERRRLSDSAHNEYHAGDPDCPDCGDEGCTRCDESED